MVQLIWGKYGANLLYNYFHCFRRLQPDSFFEAQYECTDQILYELDLGNSKEVFHDLSVLNEAWEPRRAGDVPLITRLG